MKKFFCLAMLLFVFLVSICHGKDTAKKKLSAKELKQERKKLITQIYEERIALIKKDPLLKKLHNQIMQLHKKLALILENKKSMRVLLEKQEKIDAQLKDVAPAEDDEDLDDL